ncbi:MAG: TVP38/TMEM64 family protein [Halanaeroarchaeum sp.]
MPDPADPPFGHQPSARQRVAVAVVALALFVGGALLAWAGRLSVDPVALRTWVDGFGVFAPLVVIAAQALQVLVAPVPGQVLGLAAGYLFGPIHGTVYSVLGAAIGSFVAFSASRRFGRPFVAGTVDPETMAWFDDVTDRRGYLGLFLVFLVPGLPDDLICFVAGLSRMDLWRMTAISIVGRVPGYYLVALGGAELAAARYVQAAVLVGAVALFSLLGFRYRHRVTDVVDAVASPRGR